MTLPLTDVLVVDMGDEPLALASRLLGDLGADVVRVEPIDGDPLRRRGPFVGDLESLESGLAHILYNAGKRSLALALDRPVGWEVVGQLAAKAEIIIAPLEPSPLAADFFADAHLRSVAPRVGVVDAVYRRNSNDRAVTDLTGTAAGGLLYLNGFPEDPPNHPAGNLAYKQTSLAAAFAAMSLILEQGISDKGGRITVSMQEAVMWTTIQTANENYWPWHHARPGRRGIANIGGRTVFQARDGLWVSFVQHPPAWGAFAEWVAEVFADARFLGPEWEDGLYRFEHNDDVTEVTERLARTMDRDELVADAQRRSILVVPVQGVADISKDPHLRERGFFQRVEYSQLGMELEVMRPPLLSSQYRATARRAPALGEHSREVLRETCAMSETDIDRLIGEGTVGVYRDGVKA